MSLALSPGLGHNGGPPLIIGAGADALPVQDWQQLLLHHERFHRDAEAHQKWAAVAKKCVDYFEGKQWSAADMAKLADEGRPVLTLNKIRALVNLVLGYHINNRTDRKTIPTNDGSGTAEMAEMMSHVLKSISDINQLKFVDSEVYLDGLLGGRGYWETTHDWYWTNNQLGECRVVAVDPFSVLLDADASDYDPNGSTHTRITKTDWVSQDEVEAWYGERVLSAVSPMLGNGISTTSMSTNFYEGEEISPARTFAQEEDGDMRWRTFRERSAEWVDVYRKTLRRVNIQHWVRCWRWAVVDLETGDRRWIPDNWTEDQRNKMVLWARQMNEPIALQKVRTRRLRWTHVIGDIIAFDRWSPYNRVTLTPFFPYFRRGATQGMVEPLIDVQDEINVRRSARLNIVMRSGNSGWKIHTGTLTPEEESRLEREGGRAGFVLKYNLKGNLPQPEQITPQMSPVSIAELEHEAADDMLAIAGINRAALGQVDGTHISGKNLQMRQQSTVMGQEMFQQNWHRSVQLSGLGMVDVVQTHYREPRLLRVRGMNSANPIEVAINVRAAAGIINDVTVGKYAIQVDETSLSESFLATQFGEMLMLMEKGMPIPDDFLIDASSIGRKEELRAMVAQARAAQAAAPPPPTEPGKGPAQPGTQSPAPPQPPQPPQAPPRAPR